MFQHPLLVTQFAADRRRARTTEAHHHQTVAGLGEQVAETGIDAAAAQVAAVVRLARRAGVRPELVAVVADPTQPAVARERALGRLLAALDLPPTSRRSAVRPAA